MRLKQIRNHPSQFIGNQKYKASKSGKFQHLAELGEELASSQEKVLIFTQFREFMDALATLLTNVFHAEGFMLHGGTSLKKRQSLVDAFQKEGGPPFFLLSLELGGMGLNLKAANHVIHLERWWNPAIENQATDRAF